MKSTFYIPELGYTEKTLNLVSADLDGLLRYQEDSTYGNFTCVTKYTGSESNHIKFTSSTYYAASDIKSMLSSIGLSAKNVNAANSLESVFNIGSTEATYTLNDNDQTITDNRLKFTGTNSESWLRSNLQGYVDDVSSGNITANNNLDYDDDAYIYTFPCVFIHGGGAYFGGMILQSWSSSSDNAVIDIYFNRKINNENYVPIERQPGDTGFIPAGDYPDDGTGIGGLPPGGEKIPPYKTDVIGQPDAPDESTASAISSGFITAYDVTQANLASFATCLFGSTLEGLLANLFAKPMDYVISLNVFPCKPSMGSSRPIKIGRWSCETTELGVNANGFPLTKQFKTFDFGSLNVGENFGSFLDYTQTTIELFLPFIGSVDIAVSEIMNGSINVQYTVDFLTGTCVANVLCTKTIPLANGLVIPQYSQHSYQGNCAIQIPVGSVGYGSMIGSLINGSIKAVGGALTDNVGLAIAGAGEVIVAGSKPQASTKGSIGANAGFCSVLYPYIRVTRPIPVTPTSFQEVNGYPSFIDSTLGACTGLCVCDSIKLQGVTGATDSEMDRITQMCKEGVYV